MEKLELEIQDPEAWQDLFDRVPENAYPTFADGRKSVKRFCTRVVAFEYAPADREEVDCRECSGAGVMYSNYHKSTVECPHCDEGKVFDTVGPGVIGSSIVIEIALIHASAHVGGEHIVKRFRYVRGCISPDNRTGSCWFDDLEEGEDWRNWRVHKQRAKVRLGN